MSVSSWCSTCFFCCSVYLFVYRPFCHGALKIDMSTLFTTFFLWTSLQFIQCMAIWYSNILWKARGRGPQPFFNPFYINHPWELNFCAWVQDQWAGQVKQRGTLKTLLSNSDVLNIKVYNVFKLEKLPSKDKVLSGTLAMTYWLTWYKSWKGVHIKQTDKLRTNQPVM